jgi:hypothetical protein
MDRTLLAIDGSPIPGDPGMRQLFSSRPGVTSDGRAFWHGGASPVGSVHPHDVLPQWEALLIETAAGPVIPWVSSGLAVSGKVLRSIGPFAVSHAGGYAICIGRLDDGSEALIRAGWDEEEGGPIVEPVRFGGTPVAKGRSVSALGAASGEQWQRFLHVGAGEGTGMPPHWFVVAQIGTASESRHAIVMSNGSINYIHSWEGLSYNNGDGTGARTLQGAPKHVAVNQQGDIAAVWRVNPGNKEALFLNERRLVETGDPVPMRNGQVGTLASILGVNTVALSGRDPNGVASVFFIGNVRPPPPPGMPPEYWYERVQTLYRIDYAVSTGKVCSADWNLDGQINSSDISAFLSAWLADLSADPPTFLTDFNNDGAVNSADISAFLTAWLAGVGGGC